MNGDNASESLPVPERPAQEAVVLAALGYLPLLFFLPLFAARGEPFAKHHGRQSLVAQVILFVFWIGVWASDFLLGRVLGNMLILGFVFRFVAWVVHYPLGFLVSLAYVVLAAFGIIQALSGQAGRMPVISAYADRLAL